MQCAGMAAQSTRTYPRGDTSAASTMREVAKWSQYDYTVAMKQTSVAALKASLSHYLRLARQGHTIEVLSHRQPVARIVPVAESRESLVIPPERPLSELRKLRGVRVHADPVAALLEERARR